MTVNVEHEQATSTTPQVSEDPHSRKWMGDGGGGGGGGCGGWRVEVEGVS